MKSLKLFNAVLAKPATNLVVNTDLGFVIEREAAWAEKDIVSFYEAERLSGNDLNKTFHKSWKKILESTREELAIHQIFHYLSTYGTDFTGEIYIPNEVLNIPDDLSLKVIKAYTRDEMIEKSLGMLRSGIALKDETINDLIGILDELGHQFTGKEGIQNKEAMVKIAELFHVYPESPVEFLRFIIYRATGEALLIKSPEVIQAIKDSKFNPSMILKGYGLEKLAQVFNRFKPIFLSFKNKCPKTINKISRLSKYHHKPMVENPLNHVTHRLLTDEDKAWLDNATPYALFRAMQACHSRAKGQTDFVYRIRNGKSWVAKDLAFEKARKRNLKLLKEYLASRFDFTGKTIYFPEDIEYALPISEKMFVGNLPTGTKIYGERLAVGLYWENDWGARDIDISGLNIGGKVGWNSVYNQSDNLLYSGDITNAPNGAVEYLHASGMNIPPTLLMANIYSGETDCGYKLIAGKGADISREYMMDPKSVMLEVKCQSVQKQNVVGMFLPEDKRIVFVVLNFGAGNVRVSGNSPLTSTATSALYHQWKDQLTLKSVCKELGATVTDKTKADIDLSLETLEKDTFIGMFNG